MGQVLLPPGEGSRGVELIIRVRRPSGEARDRWLLFDEHGRFSHTFRDSLIGLTVSTGIRAILHHLDAQELPRADQGTRIDVGMIDLREKLTRHRMVVRAAADAPSGEVRIAMCFGLPPVGPGGEPVSLGSRQFPPVDLGREVEWLLPREADSVYYLVERPRDLGFQDKWQSGPQRLFGPFNSSSLPGELTID